MSAKQLAGGDAPTVRPEHFGTLRSEVSCSKSCFDSGTLLQRQCALDRFIARQCAPGREGAVELRVGMPRPHVRMPAFDPLSRDGS